MDQTRFSEVFERILDDRRVSRGERKVLNELLTEACVDDRERGLLTHLLFERVCDHLKRQTERELVLAARDIVNILKPSESGKKSHIAEVHFSSEPNVWRRVAQLIDDCRSSLDICVYTITDDRLAARILEALRRHVKVRIVSDDEKVYDPGSDILRLAQAGIEVALDHDDAFMHHKFGIFDNTLLLTGSYNWTRGAAERNWENFIVTDDPRLVQPYINEFQRLYASFGKFTC